MNLIACYRCPSKLSSHATIATIRRKNIFVRRGPSAACSSVHLSIAYTDTMFPIIHKVFKRHFETRASNKKIPDC